MSKRLEDFIRNNREDFDELEPRMELWGNIVAKLQEQEKTASISQKREAKTFSLGFVLRVAATVIMVMGISFVLYIKYQQGKPIDYAKINPEYAKERMQYASMVQNKRAELQTLTKTNPGLYREFSAEIAKMDATYKKLNNDLATSPNQERVFRAMIRNLQIQTEVLNQQLNVIEQFNEFNKPQTHETKSI
jgi:hypothetical protein